MSDRNLFKVHAYYILAHIVPIIIELLNFKHPSGNECRVLQVHPQVQRHNFPADFYCLVIVEHTWGRNEDFIKEIHDMRPYSLEKSI